MGGGTPDTVLDPRDAEPLSKRSKASTKDSADQYAEGVADALTSVWNGSSVATEALGHLLSSEQVVWHDSLLPGEDLTGLDQLQALVATFRAALPDLQLVFQRPLHTGEEGLVLGYWRAEGTHSAALGSLQPSGVRASWEGSLVVRTRRQEQQAQEEPQQHDPQQQQQQQPNGSGGADGPQVEQQHGEPGAAQQGGEEKEQEGSGAQSQSGKLLGVEVWWSWDPVFLFRQLGWEQGTKNTGTAVGQPLNGESAVNGQDGRAKVGLQLATQTAAAARDAYGSEEAAVAAAEAAVAAAAAAAERLPVAADGAAALAAVQAANRAVVELYFHTYNTGHYAVLDHIVHPDYHYDGLLDLGDRRGRAAMAAMMGGWRDCLPDLAIGHELFAAVGTDRVTFRWVIQGTHSAPGSKLLGVPAGGARLLVKGVTTLTLRDGRICRKISHANAADTLRQLGAAVPPVIAVVAAGQQQRRDTEAEAEAEAEAAAGVDEGAQQ